MTENQSTEKQESKKWYEPIVDWFKANGNKAIDYIMEYGGTYIASQVSGFWGVVVKYAWQYVITPLLKYYRLLIKNKAEEKEKLEQFKEEIKKEQTDDERKKSESDFLGD